MKLGKEAEGACKSILNRKKSLLQTHHLHFFAWFAISGFLWPHFFLQAHVLETQV